VTEDPGEDGKNPGEPAKGDAVNDLLAEAGMVSAAVLRRDRLETHLGELMRVACHDPGAGAQLEEMAPGMEGRIEIISMGREHPIAVISSSLELDGAEAAVMHEAGHWLEGHEILGSEEWKAYAAAKAFDQANGTRTRGPWEQAADRHAITLLGDKAVQQVLETDPARIAKLTLQDAEQFGPFDDPRTSGSRPA
jgi:hypothetical protein